MDFKTYLLIKAAEEASEIAQIALKSSIFGLDSVDPRENTGEFNYSKLIKEVHDLSTVLFLLAEEIDADQTKLLENSIKDFDANEYVKMKTEKLIKYYEGMNK